MASQSAWPLRALVAALVLTGLVSAAPLRPAPPVEPFVARFTAHTLDIGLAGGYQVVVADLNRDGKPDIIAVASGLKELRWYENPGWQPHVLVTGINQPINAAATDVDGDGIPEIALAHEFSNVYGKSAGIVSILTHQGDSAGPWAIKEIDRVPTSHRVRFVDIDGTGKKVLVNFPLIGSQATAPEYRDHVSLLMYRPGEWRREVVTDAEEGDGDVLRIDGVGMRWEEWCRTRDQDDSHQRRDQGDQIAGMHALAIEEGGDERRKDRIGVLDERRFA